MLRYAHAVKSRHPILLLWGNKRKDDIIFRQELKQMTLDMERFKTVHILSREKTKRGEKGHVDMERIRKYVEQPLRANYFICGPAGLRKNMVRALKELGVEEKRIHVEKFSMA
jgi:ferredoxin-NADP reductase